MPRKDKEPVTDLAPTPKSALEAMRQVGIPVFTDLVEQGVMPERPRALAPDDIAGRFMVILTNTIEFDQHTSSFSGKVVEGLRCQMIDPETGEQKLFMTESLALVAQAKEQIIPALDKIGARLAVYTAVRPHKTLPDAPVYTFW